MLQKLRRQRLKEEKRKRRRRPWSEKPPPTAKPALASAASKDTFIKAKLKTIYDSPDEPIENKTVAISGYTPEKDRYKSDCILELKLNQSFEIIQDQSIHEEIKSEIEQQQLQQQKQQKQQWQGQGQQQQLQIVQQDMEKVQQQQQIPEVSVYV